MQTKIPFILIVAFIILGGMWFVIVRGWFTSSEHITEDTPLTLPEQPSQPDTSEKVSLRTANGGSIVVNDFLKNSVVTADQYNDGLYTLGPRAEDGEVYTIDYIKETDFFTITLLAEPLSESRRAAELYLQNLLGISEEQMCQLAYTVSVPRFVNEYVAGDSFGFSFCADAKGL